MDNFVIEEMKICRLYCAEIHKERARLGFQSLKYPLITVAINRYFLPEYRQLIADECNLVGYMGIEPVEYLETTKTYDKTGRIIVKLDTTRSTWQDKLYEDRVIKRKRAEARKEVGIAL